MASLQHGTAVIILACQRNCKEDSSLICFGNTLLPCRPHKQSDVSSHIYRMRAVLLLHAAFVPVQDGDCTYGCFWASIGLSSLGVGD